MVGYILPFHVPLLLAAGNRIASFLLCRRLVPVVLPAFHGAAAMRPDRFRRLFGFMEGLQTRVFFFVLPDSLVRRVLDGLPDDVSFRFLRFHLLLFTRLYGRCLFLGLN